MEAVHGSIIIKRRESIIKKSNYKSYLKELREDFSCVCGYCGKPENITRKGFEIDHLVPVSFAPDRGSDYYNLVYSCYTCNRKKSKKFPMEPLTILHDDEKGLIDPATYEYNENIGRDSNGNIVGITKLGKYVCEKIFLFHIRPMATIYKLSVLKKKLNELFSCPELITAEMAHEISHIQKLIVEFDKLIFDKRE